LENTSRHIWALCSAECTELAVFKRFGSRSAAFGFFDISFGHREDAEWTGSVSLKGKPERWPCQPKRKSERLRSPSLSSGWSCSAQLTSSFRTPKQRRSLGYPAQENEAHHDESLETISTVESLIRASFPASKAKSNSSSMLLHSSSLFPSFSAHSRTLCFSFWPSSFPGWGRRE
jgi:hypothetical protein